MDNEIIVTNSCEVNRELDYVSIEFNQRFGERTKEQCSHPMERIISIFNWDIIPRELQNFVTEWKEKIKDQKYYGSCLFIDNAQINFGYGDRVYRINGRTLSVYDSVIEEASEDILKGLMEIGCNYGEYVGYLD